MRGLNPLRSSFDGPLKEALHTRVAHETGRMRPPFSSCVHSRPPMLRERGEQGGCVSLRCGGEGGWKAASSAGAFPLLALSMLCTSLGVTVS